MSRVLRAEQGSALLVALLLVAILGAGAAMLVPVATTERLLATVSREATACRYAAEAVAAYALNQLQVRADWNGVLNESFRPPFADTTRTPTIGGSRRLVLDALGAVIPAVEPGNWGQDRPRWVLFAWGPAGRLAPGAVETGIYVAAWVADDERDGDRDPRRDSNGRIRIRAEAFGPVRGRRAVLLTVVREAPAPAALRVIDWTMY